MKAIIEPYYLLSPDPDNVNCPKCGVIYFKDDWYKMSLKNAENKAAFQCKRCKYRFFIRRIGNNTYTWLRRWQAKARGYGLKKLTKQQNTNEMVKTIKIESHLARYKEVSMAQKLALISGLQAMIEQERKDKIEQMKKDLEIFEQGGVPESYLTPPKQQAVAEPVTDADFEVTEEETTSFEVAEGEQFPDLLGDALEPANGTEKPTTSNRKKR